MSEKLFLDSPSKKYKESYIEAVKEDHEEGRNIHIDSVYLENHFTEYVSAFIDEASGVNLAEGRVSQTTLWLIEENEYVGRISIRHYLTEKLMREGGHIGYEIRPSRRRLGYGTQALKLALSIAKEIGLDRVLVTCDSNNIGSKKIIERNGGAFEDEVSTDDGKPSKLRYWIDLR